MARIPYHLKHSLIVLSIREAISQTGQVAYLESQKVVPVLTGYLRGSGNLIGRHDGITLKYSADYASHVERDWEGGRVWTNSYTRKDGVFVKAHYKNQPPREGRKFIENSLMKFFIEKVGHTSFFQDMFLLSLKRKFPGKRVQVF